MPASEYRDWVLYANAHPFGDVRQNLHAAMIAAEVRRPWVKKGTRINLQDFMIISQEERREGRTAESLGMLKAMAKRGTNGGRSSKTGRKARAPK